MQIRKVHYGQFNDKGTYINMNWQKQKITQFLLICVIQVLDYSHSLSLKGRCNCTGIRLALFSFSICCLK